MKAALLAAVLLVGCGGQPRVRPSPVERAVAIGLVTLGTGAATVAAQCPDSTEDECQALSARAGAVVLSVSLAAAAQAWLVASDDEAERARKQEAIDADKMRETERMLSGGK
jgi:hypothetical protein